MAQINNIRTVSIPSLGKLPLAEKPGSFTPAGFKREHKAGRVPADGGYTESGTPAKLELNINLIGTLDLEALNAVVDEDVTIRLSSGEVWMMSRAYVSDPVSIADGDARVMIVSNSSEKIG